MKLIDIIRLNGFTVYSLSKRTNIPYSTLNDLIKGITKIENLSFKYAMKLADTLGISPSMLLRCDQEKFIKRVPFPNFRSNVLHALKNSENPEEFIKSIINSKKIDNYHKSGYLEESYYLIALIDTLCDRYNLPKYELRLNKFRREKLSKVFNPAGILSFKTLDDAAKEFKQPLLEQFAKYNIVEVSIDDAV